MLEIANDLIAFLIAQIESEDATTEHNKMMQKRTLFEMGVVKELIGCDHSLSLLGFPDGAMLIYRMKDKTEIEMVNSMMARGFLFINIEPEPVSEKTMEEPEIDDEDSAT